MTNRDFKAEFIPHFQNCPNDPLWSKGLQKINASSNKKLAKWNAVYTNLHYAFKNSLPNKLSSQEQLEMNLSMLYETQLALKNNEAFWFVAGYFWRICGTYDYRWLESFVAQERMKVSRNLRSDYMTWGSMSVNNANAKNAALNYIPKFFNRQNKSMKIYRAFWVPSHEQIRMSNDIANEKFYEQNAGSGLSYSLSKAYATFVIGSKFSIEYLRRHTSLSESEIQLFQQNRIREDGWTYDQVRRATSLNLRPIVATYVVQKDDIIAFLANDEEEIIILKKPKLLRYDVITYQDAFAASTLIDCRDQVQANAVKQFYLKQSETPMSYIPSNREKYLLQALRSDYRKLARVPNLKAAEMLDRSNKIERSDTALAQKTIDNFTTNIRREFESNLTF